MISYLLYINSFVLVLSAIIATLFFKKTKNTPLKHLGVYLWFIVFAEIVAHYLAIKYKNNLWWYNIVFNIEKIYYFSLFYRYITNKISKKLLFFGIVFFEIFFVVFYIFFSEGWHLYQSFSISFGGFIVTVAIFVFLIELFKSDSVLYAKDFMIFWVGIGILIYLIIGMPFNIVYYYTQRVGENFGRSILHIQQYVQLTVNIIMYSLFIYGYIWSNKQYK